MRDGNAKRVEKPWGFELIWSHTDKYVGKLIVVESGKRLSLQLHRKKEESIYVAAGRMRLHLENDDGEIVTREMGPGDHCHIPVGRRHRFEAIERVEILEVSTPELDDVVRIEDDYGRSEAS